LNEHVSGDGDEEDEKKVPGWKIGLIATACGLVVASALIAVVVVRRRRQRRVMLATGATDAMYVNLVTDDAAARTGNDAVSNAVQDL